MLVEILERVPTKKGQLTPGQLVELPQEVITKLAGRVRPATFDQVHGQLDRMGDWTDVTDLAAKKCPDLLEAARQAGRDVDRDPALIGRYYQAWRAVFLAAQRQPRAADNRTADQLTPAERSRWCMAHELTQPGHRCQHRSNPDTCILWRAIRERWPLARLAEAQHAPA